MRLICPNCGAEYEIDATLIPAGGRDVQCSDCGHMWFERGAEAETDGSRAPRRELDEQTRRILREEAEREAAARRTRRAQIETQTEMPLEAAHGKSASASDSRNGSSAEADERAGQQTPGDLPDDRTSDAATQTDPAVVPATDGTGTHGDGERPADRAARSRGDLFPDIDEINSTLAPATADDDGRPAAVDDDTDDAAARRGFSIVLLASVALVLVYLYAPRLAEAVPALEPSLASYVSGVNDFRTWVDGVLAGAAASLSSVAG